MQRIDYPTIDSTNAEARRLLSGAAPGSGRSVGGPFVVVAERQTGGRGRLGRAWTSPPGGVWATLAWPMRRGAGAYGAAGLVAAAAAAQAVERSLGPDAGAHRVSVKWPNDILLDGRKVCGILCEAVSAPGSFGWMLIGIGINASFDEALLPADVRFPAATISGTLGRGVDAGAITDDLIALIRAPLLEVDRDGAAPASVGAVRRRLAWVGEPVRLELGGRPTEGVLRGIDDGGRLLLETGGTLVPVASGEVSTLRPSAAAD